MRCSFMVYLVIRLLSEKVISSGTNNTFFQILPYFVDCSIYFKWTWHILNFYNLIFPNWGYCYANLVSSNATTKPIVKNHVTDSITIRLWSKTTKLYKFCIQSRSRHNEIIQNFIISVQKKFRLKVSVWIYAILFWTHRWQAIFNCLILQGEKVSIESVTLKTVFCDWIMLSDGNPQFLIDFFLDSSIVKVFQILK